MLICIDWLPWPSPHNRGGDTGIVLVSHSVMLMMLCVCRLNDPTATLFGFDSSYEKQQAVIVSLASPVVDIAAKVNR